MTERELGGLGSNLGNGRYSQVWINRQVQGSGEAVHPGTTRTSPTEMSLLQHHGCNVSPFLKLTYEEHIRRYFMCGTSSVTVTSSLLDIFLIYLSWGHSDISGHFTVGGLQENVQSKWLRHLSSQINPLSIMSGKYLEFSAALKTTSETKSESLNFNLEGQGKSYDHFSFQGTFSTHKDSLLAEADTQYDKKQCLYFTL